MLVKQKSLSHSCEKGFCIYYDSVQIYASGFLTPAVRNDNGNNNEALQSHKSLFLLTFCACKVIHSYQTDKANSFFFNLTAKLRV